MTPTELVDAALGEARMAIDAVEAGAIPRSVGVWLATRALDDAAQVCTGPIRRDLDGPLAAA